MRPIATHVACYYYYYYYYAAFNAPCVGHKDDESQAQMFRCLWVCLLDTPVNPAKTAEPIEMPFREEIRVAPCTIY